jgi:hypothetical protein
MAHIKSRTYDRHVYSAPGRCALCELGQGLPRGRSGCWWREAWITTLRYLQIVLMEVEDRLGSLLFDK